MRQPYSRTRPDISLLYDEFRDYYLSLGLDHLQVSVWFLDDYSKELERAGFLSAYRDKVWDDSLMKVFPFLAPLSWHPDSWVGDKPLFAWVSFSGPHYPFDAPREYLSRVDRTTLWPKKIKDGELADPSRIHHPCNYAEDHACMNFTNNYWEDLRVLYGGVLMGMIS